MSVCPAAFDLVGLRIESSTAAAFVAALGEAEETVEDECGDRREWVAVDRVIGGLSRLELVRLVDELGLGRVTVVDGEEWSAPRDPVRRVLLHLLRDRLVDALRISAGRRPFWTWDAVGRPPSDEGARDVRDR